MKTCTGCKQKKSLDEFSKKNNRKNSKCKSCVNIYYREYYSNPEKREKHLILVRARNKRELKLRQDFIISYLKNNSCIDCKEDDIVVLEFDHVRGSKKFTIGALAQVGASLNTLKKEISKCDVRCANCHKRKTAREFGYYKWKAK